MWGAWPAGSGSRISLTESSVNLSRMLDLPTPLWSTQKIRRGCLVRPTRQWAGDGFTCHAPRVCVELPDPTDF